MAMTLHFIAQMSNTISFYLGYFVGLCLMLYIAAKAAVGLFRLIDRALRLLRRSEPILTRRCLPLSSI